jgi:hypothetical protein
MYAVIPWLEEVCADYPNMREMLIWSEDIAQPPDLSNSSTPTTTSAYSSITSPICCYLDDAYIAVQVWWQSEFLENKLISAMDLSWPMTKVASMRLHNCTIELHIYNHPDQRTLGTIFTGLSNPDYSRSSNRHYRARLQCGLRRSILTLAIWNCCHGSLRKRHSVSYSVGLVWCWCC